MHGCQAAAAGSWVELEVSTLQEEKAEEGVLGRGTVAEEQKRSTLEGTSNATLHLGYLRSYERMGLAQATCTQGCFCEPSYIEGLWADRTSLTQMHSIKVNWRWIMTLHLLRLSPFRNQLCLSACRSASIPHVAYALP